MKNDQLQRSFQYLTTLQEKMNDHKNPYGFGEAFPEFLKFSDSVVDFILQNFPNDHYIESKVAEIPNLAGSLERLQPNTLIEILMTICRATIVLIPLSIWYNRKREEAFNEILNSANQKYGLIAAIVFKLQNPNLVKHEF